MSKPRKPACSIKEVRAILEILAHFSARPLMKLMNRGDGHPVIVIPGFLATSHLTSQMRTVLSRQGYDVYDWGQGVNLGYSQDKIDNLVQLVSKIKFDTGKDVSIVGWSLGGLYARAIANTIPEHIRQVITLGSPFMMPTDALKEKPDSLVVKAFQAINPDIESMSSLCHLWINSPPVPTTSIYTKTDGIVNWSYCQEVENKISENIRVNGSHTGLMHNPIALIVVLDRLEQTKKGWLKYSHDRNSLFRFIERKAYKDMSAEPIPA
jgi:pimeloyl-ACP methyl ester carboxylesterase